MTPPIKSRRGVYYDLNKSPYVYKTPYGDLFRFSSQKKLDIYARDIKTELQRFEKIITRLRLGEFVEYPIIEGLRHGIYQAFYKQVEK